MLRCRASETTTWRSTSVWRWMRAAGRRAWRACGRWTSATGLCGWTTRPGPYAESPATASSGWGSTRKVSAGPVRRSGRRRTAPSGWIVLKDGGSGAARQTVLEAFHRLGTTGAGGRSAAGGHGGRAGAPAGPRGSGAWSARGDRARPPSSRLSTGRARWSMRWLVLGLRIRSGSGGSMLPPPIGRP
jgi:hypothetical protein